METNEMNTTIESAAIQRNLDLENKIFTNPIETNSKTGFDNMPMETVKHGFIRKNNVYLRRGVPESHKRAADNFMIIKKIFGQPVVQPKLNDEEKELLARFDFNLLEYTTSKQIEEELVFLKRWSYSRSSELQESADNIIKIRTKELKYLIATKFVNITNPVYNGYKVIEKYFEDISKYFDN